jgi:hypothetical protein
MLVDERTYVIAPGCLARYLDWHRSQALPLMREHLGEPLAYFSGVDGELNTFVHLWAYADASDREVRRTRLYADPRWLRYRQDTGTTGWVIAQHNWLLQPLADVALGLRGSPRNPEEAPHG